MNKNNLQDYFTAKSTGKNVLIFLVLYLMMQVSMMLIAFPLLQFYSLDVPMDARFIYSAKDVSAYLTSLTVHGRNVYTAIGLLDMVFPIIYAIFFGLLLSYLFIKTRLDKSIFFYLRYVPFAAGLFDIAENICMFIITKAYPDQMPLLVKAANIATLGKWIGTPITLLLITILTLLIGINKIGNYPAAELKSSK